MANVHTEKYVITCLNMIWRNIVSILHEKIKKILEYQPFHFCFIDIFLLLQNFNT